MRLELGTFPIREAAFGERTRWTGGVLEIDRNAVLALARTDPNIAFADVELARPGESVRIVDVIDAIEPRVKPSGGGTVYPGFCGRPVTPVGRGRTHRLGGFAVVKCVAGAGRMPSAPDGRDSRIADRRLNFIDMSGPGAVRPLASTINLVVTLGPAANLDAQDQHLATQSALLRIADHLAAAVAELDPPELEIFDLSSRSPSLPGFVYIPVLASFELWGGPDSRLGVGVYGVTRLSAPWVLHPTELMDGAVSQTTIHGLSWQMINNPIVMELARRHGQDVNFLAVIVHRSNWGGQAEMELAADRDAQAAVLLGAKAAIITTDIRGRRFVDAIAAVRACEVEGIKSVLVTEEEDDERGSATPLLINDPAIAAAVSTGTGAVPGPFRPVERVLGAREPDSAWHSELPPIPGRYGAFHLQDYYGFGRQSCASY